MAGQLPATHLCVRLYLVQGGTGEQCGGRDGNPGGEDYLSHLLTFRVRGGIKVKACLEQNDQALYNVQ